MHVDQALAQVFKISLLLRMKLPDPVQKQSFLAELLQKPLKDKEGFLTTLIRADKSLKELKKNFLDSNKKTKQKIIGISKEAKDVCRTAIMKTAKNKRQSLNPLKQKNAP